MLGGDGVEGLRVSLLNALQSVRKERDVHLGRSKDMKRAVGTPLCMHGHAGFLAKGQIHIEYADGCVVEHKAPQIIAIDPGPTDPEHLERLWRAAGGDIRHIVCTHSHPDHSPGAAPLQALCAQHGHTPPILGLRSAPTARTASQFTPDRELADGERLVLQGGGTTHTLRVLHTPGHAANHVCLVLEEDGLLFSGDHVLNGSTTVVDPPDGLLDGPGAAKAEHGD